MLYRARIWTITLWTAGRVPSLVSFADGRVEPSLLGVLTLTHWSRLAGSYPTLVLDEFALLPDRFRALIHAEQERLIGVAVAGFKRRLTGAARERGLLRTSWLWEAGYQRLPVESVEELASWRRRIAAGRSLGLSGNLSVKGHLEREAVFGDRGFGKDGLCLGQELGCLPAVSSADVGQHQSADPGLPRHRRGLRRRRVAGLDRPIPLVHAEGRVMDQ